MRVILKPLLERLQVFLCKIPRILWKVQRTAIKIVARVLKQLALHFLYLLV